MRSVFLSVGLLVAATLPGRADIIYSLDTDGPWQSTAGSTWLAQSFSTGAAPMTLNSVSVWIRNANESTGSSGPSSMSLWLYAADINNKPTGSALYTVFNGYGFGAWADEKPVATSLNYSLSANTTYLLVMQGSSGGTIGWKYPSATSPTSSISPTPTFYNWRSTDSGSTWSDAAPTAGFNMIVDATAAAVPEPGTWAAGALLAGGAAFLRRRKRGKVS